MMCCVSTVIDGVVVGYVMVYMWYNVLSHVIVQCMRVIMNGLDTTFTPQVKFKIMCTVRDTRDAIHYMCVYDGLKAP